MKIKMNTFMAHPKHGVAKPGEVIDLPEAVARELLAGGNADPVEQKIKPAATAVAAEPAGIRPIGDGGETASLEGASETAMQVKGRSRK